MIAGIGCDLLEIRRIGRLREKQYLDRIFTEEERRQADGRDSMLAGDFSVKEAVSKCFGTGVRGFSLRDIEVLRDELGKPYVRLFGGAEERYRAMRGRTLQVSLSNTGEHVMAMAVLESED